MTEGGRQKEQKERRSTPPKKLKTVNKRAEPTNNHLIITNHVPLSKLGRVLTEAGWE